MQQNTFYILTHRSLSNSARAIAQSIGEKIGRIVRVSYGEDKEFGDIPPLIRWGNPSFTFSKDTPYNNPDHIRTTSNKKMLSSLLHEKDIPTIRFHTGVPERFPIVVRKTLLGKGGEGIVVCHDYDDFKNHFSQYAWSYWHRFPIELGVHIFEGKILKLFKKVRSDGLPEEAFPIRNLARGYHYVRVDPANFTKLIPATMSYYQAFPIKFGRADVGWDDESKCYRIIEMNSAPAVSSNPDTLDMYVKSLMRAIFNS